MTRPARTPHQTAWPTCSAGSMTRQLPTTRIERRGRAVTCSSAPRGFFPPPGEVKTMTGTSLAGILIMVAVIVAGLVIWLGLVFWAGKHPLFKRHTPDQRTGDVRGGAFLGSGRRVMPRRDAPPDPDREWQVRGSDEPARGDDPALGVPSARIPRAGTGNKHRTGGPAGQPGGLKAREQAGRGSQCPERRSRTRRPTRNYESVARARKSPPASRTPPGSSRRKVAAKGGRSGSYQDMSKVDLVKRAREVGIKGRSSMSKSELINALRNH